MFAGHIGAALAIGRAERRINVGLFVLAAVWLDLVLWLLVLPGWELVTIPADFSSTHQPRFVFPYSHSLLAGVVWSAGLAGAMFLPNARRTEMPLRATCLVAAAVFSHWLLDALVHAPELPLAGDSSVKLGLGLWRNMPVALAVEAVITAAGLYLFVAGSGLPRARKVALTGLTLLILAFTVAGMTVAPPPPSVRAMALSSLATIAVTCALFAWLGRRAGTKHREGEWA